ncbi:uncharacterized protein N7477_005947 [Penicillium maclennaniae]|uniref:uncharacterized protein n=1 Tax=Penicillium maclennaniae TaxID=1343394 RepID=UPI002540B141|nr:uncharacterized protein N7477_005947 [Penicillium maclennaniae]KAJ5670584.1 hypothetical protein N7477_005947 [Penicillium maclennaniae]
MGVFEVKSPELVKLQPLDEKKTTTAVTHSDGSVLEADIYISAVGTTPNTLLIDKSLLVADCRVNVTDKLRVERAGERVYAVSDWRQARDKQFTQFSAPCQYSVQTLTAIYCSLQVLMCPETVGYSLKILERRSFFMVWLIKGRDYWLWTTSGLWSGSQWYQES